MIVTCKNCHKSYDDAKCWTMCPHAQFMSDEDLAQKDAGVKLLGKRVRFNHMTEPAGYVTSCGYNGLVALDTMVGDFAPHLFVVVEEG